MLESEILVCSDFASLAGKKVIGIFSLQSNQCRYRATELT